MGGTGLEDVYTSMFFGCVLGGFVRLQGVAVCDVVLIIPKQSCVVNKSERR